VSLLSSAAVAEEPPCGYKHCLWVNSSEAGGVGSLNQALKSLSALDPHSGSVELRLTAGNFNLSANLIIVGWTNFSLVGEGTTLQCLDDVGIVFRNSSDITLHNITIDHCGCWFNSTSISLNETNASSNETEFVASVTGIYFDSCTNLRFDTVKVCSSPGMGVTIYNTGGNNHFLHSEFILSHLGSDDSYIGGGGVVIETSHCIPGDSSCRDDQSKLVTEDALYMFSDCSFRANNATSYYLPFDSVYPHGRSHVGLGRGGGLSISLKGRAYRNRVVVSVCKFENNLAEWGGALYVALGDTSVDNSILVVNSSFQYNNLRTSPNETVGGGVRVEIISYPPNVQLWPGYISNVTGNSIVLRNTEFWVNFGTWGGGVSFTTTRDVPGQPSPNSFSIEGCTFGENQAVVAASAIDIASWKPDIVDSLEPFMRPVIKDCTFDSNEMKFFNISHYPVGVGSLYVNSIPVNFSGENVFVSNKDTALVVYDTYISVLNSSRMNFTQNSGRRGGALAFFGNAWLIAHEGTSFLFDGNSVGVYGLGGAVYSVHFGEHGDHNCFFQYYLFSLPPSKWNATFVFHDNKADEQPNAIYTTSSSPCAWHVASGQPGGGAFCENSTWIFEGSNRSCLNEVSTGPSKVVAENFNVAAVPGWNTTLGITTFDDYGSPVPPVLVASPMNRSQIAVANATEYISDDEFVIYGQENQLALLLLMTLDPHVVASEIRISIRPCPPGFDSVQCPKDKPSLAGMTCDCVCQTDVPGIQCDDVAKEAYLMHQYCISFDKNSSESMVVARCPYNRDHRIKLSNLTPQQLEEKVCEPYHRTGFLCSRCRKDYGVAINSYDYSCVYCKGHQRYDWFLWLLLELGPITLVCFFVILFGVSVVAPSMNAFVFFSQVVSVAYGVNIFTWFFGVDTIDRKLSYPVFFLYGVWNLDFLEVLPGICLHDQLKVLHILVINYVKALYPMILLAVCYVCVQMYDRNVRILHFLWKPFRCLQRVVYKGHQRRTSLVDAFATLTVLSYSKFMYVSFPLVSLISVYKLNENSAGNSTNSEYLKYHYYFDPDEVLHHSLANIVYFLLGVVVLAVFVGLPPIFLILYPLRFTQSCLGRLNVRIQISFRTFADIFFGAFHDGTTSGSRVDCRWFAALYLILRILLMAISTAEISKAPSYLIRQIVCTLSILIIALVQPYKEQFYNYLDVSFFALLAILNSLSFYNSQLVASRGTVEKPVFYVNYVLIYLPLIYLILMMMYKILTWRGCFTRFKQISSNSWDIEESFESRSSSGDIPAATAEVPWPDRFIHPKDYNTLSKFSSLGDSKSRRSKAEKQASTDNGPLLSKDSAPQYGSIQGHTV
jgi:hypothetical protein